MKKRIILFLGIIALVLTGCGKQSESSIYSKLKNKINSSKSYHLTGQLELMSNETVYTYDVDVSYEKDDKFRVSLKNQINGHEQIVLRNDEGVYVVTPSLNKSFKFQSEWPYNNSQAYLLQTIMEDLENDDDRIFKEEDGNYMFVSKVNYVNNNELKKQIVYVDKEYMIEKVEVLDGNDNVKITMKFNDIDMKATFNDNYFNLETNISTNIDESEDSATIEDIIYPMYIPINTNLSDQDTIKTDTGERVILTFNGDGAFVFIQENAIASKTMEIIPVDGEPIMIGDLVGAITQTSINWFSNGKEYYVVSNSLNNNELIEVAKSVSSVPVIK